MTKNLSAREKYILLLLAAVLVAALYYWTVWQPTAETIQTAEDTMTRIESDLITEEETAERIALMQAALTEVGEAAEPATITPMYDNANNLLSALNPALADTANLKMSFGDPAFENDIATRSLQISFDIGNYEQAKAVIDKISGGPYRNDVVSLKVVPSYEYDDSLHWYDERESADDDVNSYVSVSLTVHYYEIYKAPAAESTDATSDL